MYIIIHFTNYLNDVDQRMDDDIVMFFCRHAYHKDCLPARENVRCTLLMIGITLILYQGMFTITLFDANSTSSDVGVFLPIMFKCQIIPKKRIKNFKTIYETDLTT